VGSTDTAGDDFWERVRAAYPEQRPLLNLNNAAVSPPPLVVEQATIDAYRLVSRNPDVICGRSSIPRSPASRHSWRS
jgi:hypothetical protein